MHDLGSRVWGLEFRVQGIRVEDLMFWSLGFRVFGLALRFKIFGFRI